MKVIALSDIHGLYNMVTVPEGDLLVLAGDLTGRGTLTELEDLNAWLGTLPHKHKIVIAGNHDEVLAYNVDASKVFTNATYLKDEMIEIEGKKIYGTPWTPQYGRWAFMKFDRYLPEEFSKIPEGLDLLISHGPPYGILDETIENVLAGSQALYDRVEKVKPRYHVFGHIHEGYGALTIGETTFMNVSTCTRWYRPTNPPVVFDI